MKKLFLLILVLFSADIYSQAEYVETENPVYDFLNRMDSQNLIENYNSFEIPKTRKEIAGYLKEVILSKDKLDQVDKNILQELQIEFEYELFESLKNSRTIISGENYDLFSENQKYLFFLNEPEKFNIFINLISEAEGIYFNDSENDRSNSTIHGKVGGEIRGTILNKFGFFLKGSQGQIFGNKETAALRKEIAYNFKFKLQPDEGFYDETEGYLTADFDFIRFKLGRDRKQIGYGEMKSILHNDHPLFDYIQMDIIYKFFTFSFFHGKLLGETISVPDSVSGAFQSVAEKYIAYHRIGFNLSKHIKFGIGEVVVYGERGIDLSYLNPFSFYKSIEHANQDRDNSMLFADVTNNSIKGLRVFATLLIDDISYSKLGSGWWGNQTLFNAGIYSSNFYGIIPVDLRLEYMKIDPYTFTHRLMRNNYAHNGFNLGVPFQPNSELFFVQINYRFNEELRFSVSHTFSKHGANIINTDGSVTNVGGDINLGHRTFDSEKVSFLDGDSEYFRNTSALLLYEPYNQVFLSLKIDYINNSLQGSKKVKELQSFLTLNLKI